MLEFEKEIIYKKIDSLIEMRKSFLTMFIVLTGGVFGLIVNVISPFKFNIESFIKILIIVIGFLSDYVLILVTLDNSKRINYFFGKLEKGGK